jgi:2'-5' RNA ligase
MRQRLLWIASFGVPAHLTLTSYDQLQIDRALPALDALAATLGEVELAISSVAVFPDLASGSVVFLAPVETPALLALQQGCLRALARLGVLAGISISPNAGSRM